MIDLLLRSILLASLALVVLIVARRASASVRHLSTVAGLAAVLALPIFTVALPRVSLSVLPEPSAQPTVVTVPLVVSPDSAQTHVPSAILQQETTSPFPWLAIWPLGSFILCLRWSVAWLWLLRRVRFAQPVAGLSTDVRVVESGAFGMPFVAWTPRPVIVLPRSWREWPAERLEIVLRHEAAHLRRGDGASLLIARLALAAFWPNPLVWLLARAQSELAERAADDLVVAEGVPAARYADHLLAIARGPRTTGHLPALPMARKAEVAQRVEMILNPKVSRTLVDRLARRASLALALLATAPVAALAFDPQRTQAGVAPVIEAGRPRRFRLNCEIIRTDAPVEDPVGTFKTKTAIVSAKGAETLLKSTYTTARNGKVTINLRFKGRETRMELTPTLHYPGGYDLIARVDVREKGKWSPGTLNAFPREANEWALLRLPAPPNDPRGYALIVQIVPLEEEVPRVPSATLPKPKRAPEQILLRCKIFRGEGLSMRKMNIRYGDFSYGVAKDIRLPDQTFVVTSPVVQTLSGQEATVSVSLNGIENRIKLLPKLGKDGRYTLRFSLSNLKGATWRTTNSAALHMGANEYVWFGVQKPAGGEDDYQMIVQVAPVTGG